MTIPTLCEETRKVLESRKITLDDLASVLGATLAQTRAAIGYLRRRDIQVFRESRFWIDAEASLKNEDKDL